MHDNEEDMLFLAMVGLPGGILIILLYGIFGLHAIMIF
jgi:hypothetical protein